MTALVAWQVLSILWALLSATIPIAVGALIAIVGIGMQMRHDRVERERARRWEVKRDVFLGAIGAVGDYQSYLMELGNAAVDVDAASREITAKLHPLHQADIISSTATLEAMWKLADAISAASFKIMEKRIPLLKVDADLSVARKAQEQADAVLASGVLTSADPTTVTGFDRELKAINARVSDLLHEKRQVVSTLTRTAVEENAKIGELRVAAITAMRKELGFETDQARLVEMTARSSGLARQALAELDRKSAEILRHEGGREGHRTDPGSNT